MSLRSRFRTIGIPPRCLALGAFVFAGDLKGGALLSRSPVDLTLLAGGALAGVLLLRWGRGGRVAPGPGLGLLALWYLTFVPGALRAADSAYAFQKVATICTFSLLASLAPLLLVREPGELRGVLKAMALFALVITLDSLLGAGQGGQRMEGAGGGTISLGRASGFLFLSGALHFAEGGSAAALGFAAAGAVAAFFSGSRGPLVAAALALFLVLAGGRVGLGRARGRQILGAGALALCLGLVLGLAPRGSLRRTSAFLRGELGASELYRASAARACWERIPGAPWGLGWGGFAAQVDLDAGATRQYPHNLLLEVTLESGWLCGAATLLVLGAALGAARGATDLLEGRILFAGLVFCAVNALVSGDLNDNRPLLVFLSSALGLRRGVPAREGAP